MGRHVRRLEAVVGMAVVMEIKHHPPPSKFVVVNKLLLALGVVEVEGSSGVVGSGVGYPEILDADLDVGVGEGRISPGVWLGAASLVSATLFEPRGPVHYVAGGGREQRRLTPKLSLVRYRTGRVSSEMEVFLTLRCSVR